MLLEEVHDNLAKSLKDIVSVYFVKEEILSLVLS